MVLNEVIHGFKINRIRELPELSATLYVMTHEATGAELAYFERDDDNKTFAISFTTPPEDDTGVFHIIEHSVLCGSEKYPLKDPFAELLKGSLNTFLNALTYEDRTVYPVSSRCERDFLNLVDIYMDAVFSPLMLKNPQIFMQEGWHYEYNDEDSALSYNGVVYNEMKGAYSSPDDVGGMELARLLFDGTPYACDSGGNPEFIPTLTYEGLKKAHEKHYHPSNAKVILDGKIDLDKILPLISERFSRYTKRDEKIIIPPTKRNLPRTKRVRYEISQNEQTAGRDRILFGTVYSDYADRRAIFTALILSDILAGTNASPLKKALLDRGLCKDAAVYANRSREQTVIIEIRDTDEEKLEEITALTEEVIRDLHKNGIDKKQLKSTINAIEFKLRERDHGSTPEGISNALSAFGVWNYGGAPEDALLVNDVIESLKAQIDGDYFENELLKMTVDNPHRATVVMAADKEIAAELEDALSRKLSDKLLTLSADELSEIIEADDALKVWQEAEESDEAIASIPTLALSDIPQKTQRTKSSVCDIDGAKILNLDIETNGIVYISLYFDASDLNEQELSALSVLSYLYLNTDTEGLDALTLQNEIKANLGSFTTTPSIATKDGISTPYLKVTASMLSTRCDEFIGILTEVLLKSKLDNKKELSTVTAQTRSTIEDIIISSGETIALARCEASYSSAGAMTEYMNGYEMYKYLKTCESDEELTLLMNRVTEVAKKIMKRNRLTVSLAGDHPDDLTERIVSLFPKDSVPIVRKEIPPCADKYECYKTPSKVSYAAMGGFSEKICKNLGYMRAAHTILSYEHLWNTVRVKNGAYGTGFSARRDGGISFYSYRDPNPSASLDFYRESSAYLRECASMDIDLTKFIIGTIGEFDILTTPRTKALIATTRYLNGWGEEHEERAREQLLNMTAKDLVIVADILDEALSDASVVVVGNREHIDSLPTPAEHTVEI